MALHDRETRKMHNEELTKAAEDAGQKVKDLLREINLSIEYGPPSPPKEPNGKHE